MRRMLSIVLAFVLVTALASAEGGKEAAAPASQQAPVVLKWAYVYETSEAFHKRALWAAAEIGKRTEGRYQVQVFPASSLGKESDIVEGLSLGTVDIVYADRLHRQHLRTHRHRRGAFHVQGLRALAEPAKSPFFSELADEYSALWGDKVTAVTYYGARCVTSNKPINVPADMKGLKIRVPNAPLYLMFTEAVGAKRPIAFAEVYLALQQNVVDAQ